MLVNNNEKVNTTIRKFDTVKKLNPTTLKIRNNKSPSN